MTPGCVKKMTLYIPSTGVLVTGGFAAEETAEVILEDGSTCTLPDLPPPGRRQHSATGLTLCGGLGDEDTWTTCSTFTGQWETSHQLGVLRWYHVSWDSPSGIILFGGAEPDARMTTETLSPNSSTTTPAFPLPYTTRYVTHETSVSVTIVTISSFLIFETKLSKSVTLSVII